MPHHNSHYYEFGPYRLDRNGQKRAEAFLNGAIALFEHDGSKSRSVEAQNGIGALLLPAGLV